MQLALEQKSTDPVAFAPKHDSRGLKIFARSLFKDMQEQGMSQDQIIALATHLLGHVTESIKSSPPRGHA
jgi:hypothetical protein